MKCVVREINDVAGLSEVYRLVYREYFKLGYAEPNCDEILSHYAELDGIDETTVIGAYYDGELVGTNSITVDGPMGLHVDHDFPDQVGRIRNWCKASGLRLGASWRIVTKSTVRHSFGVLVDIVRATVRKGCELGLHITLYSFHPSHERRYKRFLGLQTVAYDICRAANDSPAVLMLGDSRRITSHCSRLMQPCFENCKPPRWPAHAAGFQD